MKNNNPIPLFFWRITYSHVIAYFIAGIFAIILLDYKTHFSSEDLSFMRPVSDPLVALGPFFQIFRGIFLALIFLPLRKTLTEEKYGFLKLGLLVFGLSIISTLAAAPGSIEGLIYTKIPLFYQFFGYPELILYILLFIGILWVSYKYEKRWITILSIFLVVLIALSSIMGYLVMEK